MSWEVTPDSEVPPTFDPSSTSPRKTSRSECGNGRGLSKTASTIEKTAVVAPIARASMIMAVMLKPGDLRRWRTAMRKFGNDIFATPSEGMRGGAAVYLSNVRCPLNYQNLFLHTRRKSGGTALESVAE